MVGGEPGSAHTLPGSRSARIGLRCWRRWGGRGRGRQVWGDVFTPHRAGQAWGRRWAWGRELGLVESGTGGD